MDKPILKLQIVNKEHTLDIYENQPGKLTFEIYTSNDEQGFYASVETDIESFLPVLQKLISK